MTIRKKASQRQKMSASTTIDKNDRFVRTLGGRYFLRHINRYGSLGKSELSFVSWLLGERKDALGDHIMKHLPNPAQDSLHESLQISGRDMDDFGHALFQGLSEIPVSRHHQILHFIKQLIVRNQKQLRYRGKSEIEKNSEQIQKMFGLSQNELDLVIFIFIMTTFSTPEDLFDRTLLCDRYAGRKYLCNILGFPIPELAQILTCLEQIGIMDSGPRVLYLENDIISLLQNADSLQITRHYFKRIRPRSIPLKFHFIDPAVLSYLQKLIVKKPLTPTHILLYGPPGTGKTSMAHALAKSSGDPVYTIMRAEDNRSENRRNAIIACLNMTNSGRGSIIIVDEADNLINTVNAWQFRGEVQDKGWLNHLMEKPGARIIWISNTSDGIEESVARRFAYTHEFKQFNSRQRIILFERITRANRVKCFFKQADILKFANNYHVAAGPIDLAIKKALEIGSGTSKDFQQAVRTSLDAYLIFKNGESVAAPNNIESTPYSLGGLNLSDNVDELIAQIEQFNQALYGESDNNLGGLTLLFHGPPGTGKSALARYLRNLLGRQIIIRHYSDLQSMWLGQGEKNIREAFIAATAEEAILVIDEVDSMLLSRHRARRSWEISFTNEFLTQMETFQGLLICTTNRLADLDSAALRRFTYKIDFDYLTPEGCLIFYLKLLKPLIPKPLSDKHRCSIKAIRNLAPGDFKTIYKQLYFFPKQKRSHELAIQKLEAETNLKTRHMSKSRIGF